MRKFLLKLFYFTIPLFLFLLPPAYILFVSGENFKDIDPVIAKNDNYIIGYAHNEQNYNYLKWKTLMSRDKHKVISLGSSRVLQFRGHMFDSTFYNAGYTISGIAEFVPFLQSIPQEKYPDYLIVNLDQWMFNANWDDLSLKPSKNKWSSAFNKMPRIQTVISVWRDLLRNKYNLKELQSSTMCIGLNSKVNNTGFRNDGSILYGKQIVKLLSNDTTASDYKYHDTYNRIQKGDRRFEYGEIVNVAAISELSNLLKFCKENKIELVAFLPPFADKVNERLLSTGNYKYMQSIYPLISDFFGKYNFELYDFTNLQSCNSNDDETIDGFHGGERTYLKMLIKMLEKNSILNNVAGLKKLQYDLDHSLNAYTVYGDSAVCK